MDQDSLQEDRREDVLVSCDVSSISCSSTSPCQSLGLELTISLHLQVVRGLKQMLVHLKSMTEQHPPLQTAQRFGNLAFRTYISELTKVRSVRSSDT